MAQKMSSFYPYIFTAYYNWLVDNEITPHLLIKTSFPGVEIPMQYAQNGSMVLSISPRAVANFEIGPHEISFNAMFKGIKEFVVIPYGAMQQLIALETKVAYPLYVWFMDEGNRLDGGEDDEDGEPDFESVDEDSTAPEEGGKGKEKDPAPSPSFSLDIDD